MGYVKTPHSGSEGSLGVPGERASYAHPAHDMAGGQLGDSFATGGFTVPGNPDKGMLGGDNRTDLGKFAVPGNVTPQAEMGARVYDWQGDTLFMVPGQADGEEVKGWFRSGSDALGVAGDANY